MKTEVEKFTFLAKIARNIACLTAFFALSASADDARTLGYATSGAAAALPAAPDMGGTVVNVTAAQAQYVLDGAYGSIDGKTINFTESVADTLVLGRASKYAGSGTLYRHGSHDGEAMSYADFIAYKNQATWTEGCYYERTVENVTFTADAGVIVNFTAEGGAHVYGTESAPVYDYVRDTGTWIRDTNNSFYKRAILKNITFKGLTFKAKTDFNTSEDTTVYDGFAFTGCTFETGSSTDDENQALRYYDEFNNGNVRNLVVENCTFRNCYHGIYTGNAKGVTVKGCTFETVGYNAIAIQSQGACDHGAVVITGNTFKNIGDRVIRFNEVGAGTTITIADNTADGNSGKLLDSATGKREIVAASSLPENAAEIITASNNDWGANAVVEDVFADAKPVAATIGAVSYETLDAALAAAKDGDVVDLLANATVSDYVLDKGVTMRSAGETRYEIKGLKAIAGSGVTLENVFLNLDQTLDIGGTDTTLKNCAMRAKDVGYWDIVDGKTTGFTGGTAYQGNAYTYLVRVSGTRVSLTDCLIDGTDNEESYFPNMCLAPVTGTDVTMTRCTFNEGYAACYYSTPRGTWTLEDCTFTKIFCYNIQAGDTAAKIVVKGCSLAGWTSFGSSMTEVSFEDCAFAKSSGYATIVAYKNATFSGCTFTEDYKDNLFVEANTAVDLNGCSVVDGDGQPSATVSLAGIVELDDGTAFAALDATKDENGKYTAGTFVGSADAVRAAVAEGRALKTDADGSHSLVEAVAQIGSVGYASLAEAIAAAKDGETVKLLADATEDVVVATSVTLDLGGKTLTNAGAGKVTLTIAKGATVTVKNGSIVGGASNYAIQNNGTATFEDVMATAGNVGSSMLDNFGTLTINSGTYVGGMNTVKNEPKATLTVNGGTFENSYGEFSNHTAVIYNAGSVEILGGELTNKATSPAWAYPHVVMTVWDEVNKPSTVVKGGKLTCDWTDWKASILNHAGGGTAGCTTVSGGTFNKKVPEDYCAAGFIPTANSDGTYGVKEGAYVAAIGEVKYETLQAALAAAQDGDTVKMLADAELTAAQTIAQTLVLDLNGKAIRSTVDKFLVIAKGGDLTVNDATNEGRIENTAAATSAGVLKMTGGVLTVNGGTIAANTATSAYSPTIIVDLGSPSTINLAGGRIEAIRTANHAQGVIVLRANAGATLNVTGGEIVGSEKGVFAFAWNTVNVSGGMIVGQTGNAVYAAANNTLAVWGGSLEAGGTAAALGIGGGNCTVTIGRAGGTAGDVTLSSLDFKASGFSANKATVNLLSGTVKEFQNWTSMTVEKVSLGAATLLVGTDISTKLPGSNLLCRKDAASGLYEVVELTAENAAATVLHDGVETPYNTVDQARRAVTDGDTLTLKVDYEGSLAFTAQNVTIDLGGKTLTGASNSHALSFNQSETADNRVTVKNGTIIAKGQDAACIRATSGDAAKTLTVVLGDGLTLTAGSNNRSGRVVLAKGARTAAPCADVNNGGLRVTENGTDWIYGETETAFIHANGAEVTLLNDWYSVDYDGTVKVPETAAFASAKLNLGGHTVKAYGGAAIVMGDDAKPAEGAATKSLEISNGAILTTAHGAAVCGSNKTLVLDGVQLTTTGGGKLGLYANGMTSGNAVTLKNGSALTAEQGTGLYFPGAGTLTVADSAVTGAKSGIEIRAGVLNVSGTSEIASTAESFSFENDDNGVTTTGAAVAAVKHTVGNDLTVNISGGTFKGPRGFYANDPNPTTGGSVAVAISGGTFSTAVLSEHCAAGYEPVTNADGTYGVRATFAIVAVKVSADSDKTIDIRVPYALLENVAGETQEEKVANLSKADENGNLAWVNLVAGIDSAKKVTMTAPQNNEPAVIDVDLPTVGEAPEGTDVTVRYEIRADGSESAVVSAEDVEDLVINLNGKAGIGTYRAYVCLLQNGTEVACVESANALGVLQTVCASKKTIIAVPWLSLTDGNAIAVADLVKTAGLTAGDKLHVYNKAENRYDVYELTADKAWAPKAIYKVGADGTVETASSGTPETTTIARGSGVWIERQDTTQPIVSYGAVASATVATTIDEGTAEKKAWNLLAVPTTAIDIAATFGASETDEIIVPTDGAPKVCTVKDGAWGYDKSVPKTDESGNQLGVKVVRETVTDLPAGTGFWYLNGGAVKTVNW